MINRILNLKELPKMSVIFLNWNVLSFNKTFKFVIYPRFIFGLITCFGVTFSTGLRHHYAEVLYGYIK
jgi:hypothetical protein